MDFLKSSSLQLAPVSLKSSSLQLASGFLKSSSLIARTGFLKVDLSNSSHRTSQSRVPYSPHLFMKVELSIARIGLLKIGFLTLALDFLNSGFICSWWIYQSRVLYRTCTGFIKPIGMFTLIQKYDQPYSVGIRPGAGNIRVSPTLTTQVFGCYPLGGSGAYVPLLLFAIFTLRTYPLGLYTFVMDRLHASGAYMDYFINDV